MLIYALSFGALLFFLMHVVLLLASFSRGQFHTRRYFYSHATLWVTGLLIFVLTLLFAGQGKSHFIDYFDTPFKKVMILIAVACLSLLAHGIVKLLVLPARNR